MSEALNVTNKGLDLIKAWHAAVHQVEETKRVLNRDETTMMNAAIALSKWAVPADAIEGETFMLPVGDGFLSVKVKSMSGLGSFNAEFRWRSFPSEGL